MGKALFPTSDLHNSSRWVEAASIIDLRSRDMSSNLIPGPIGWVRFRQFHTRMWAAADRLSFYTRTCEAGPPTRNIRPRALIVGGWAEVNWVIVENSHWQNLSNYSS